MDQPTHEAIIARKREEVAAKIAAMKAKFGSAGAAAQASSPTPVATPTPMRPQALSSTAASGSGSGTSSPAPNVAEDLARKVAEAKRRVAEAQSKLAVKDNPYLVRVSASCKSLKLLTQWMSVEHATDEREGQQSTAC